MQCFRLTSRIELALIIRVCESPQPGEPLYFVRAVGVPVRPYLHLLQAFYFRCAFPACADEPWWALASDFLRRLSYMSAVRIS